MSTLLKRLKALNIIEKLTVFGFVREMQNESSWNIPMVIFYLCLSYFFEPECFEKCGKGMEISKDGLTLHNKSR